MIADYKVLLTGATGFIGREVLKRMTDVNLTVLGRKKIDLFSGHSFHESVINESSDYTDALNEIDVVIHCAGVSNILGVSKENILTEYRKINTLGCLNLAKQAAHAGVKRFIFISTIKVNGEFTASDHIFSPDDPCATEDPYGLSKYEAEKGLLQLSKKCDMDVVIIRPPMVYGPNVKGNFLSLVQLVNRGFILPFGYINNNKRSFIALDNLISFILCCADYVEQKEAANQVFLVSDGDDVSTVELLNKISIAYDKNLRMIFVPIFFLKIILNLLRKGNIYHKLFSSLQVDISKTKELLGWQPIVTMSEQLEKMADNNF